LNLTTMMEPSHGYHAYGLNILSCLDIPHWPRGMPPWDVVIEPGVVPEELANAEVLWDGKFHGRVGTCIFDFPRAGRMRIDGGRRITVAPSPEGVPGWFVAQLATTGFAALLYQRGALCLHASAVAFNDRAYLVVGPSGAGKSTTASALLKRGCQFISDDVTVITARAGGGFDARASYPTVRLNFDSHVAVKLGAAAPGEREESLDDKFRLRYLGLRVEHPQPIARICFLENDPSLSRPRAMRMRGQERVSVLQRNFFRRSIGRVVTDPAQLAALSIALAQETEVVRLTRPTSGFALDELCELVLK
jgi:hypothetical protein